MPQCAIFGCPSGRKTYSKGLETRKRIRDGELFFFKATSEDMLEAWNQKIALYAPLATDLTLDDWICSDHFAATDILMSYQIKHVNKTTQLVPLGTPILQGDAVPCYFKDSLDYLTSLNKKKRPVIPIVSSVSNKKPFAEEYQKDNSNSQNIIELEQYLQERERYINLTKDVPAEGSNLNLMSKTDPQYVWPIDEIRHIRLPLGWTLSDTSTADSIVLTYADTRNPSIIMTKSICFKKSGGVEVQIRGQNYTLDEPPRLSTIEDAKTFFISVDKLRICQGTGKNEAKYSSSCMLVTTRSRRCEKCGKLRKLIFKREDRMVRCLMTKKRH